MNSQKKNKAIPLVFVGDINEEVVKDNENNLKYKTMLNTFANSLSIWPFVPTYKIYAKSIVIYCLFDTSNIQNKKLYDKLNKYKCDMICVRLNENKKKLENDNQLLNVDFNNKDGILHTKENSKLIKNLRNFLKKK